MNDPVNEYQRIARAIDFIQAHTQQQPSLEEIATHVQLSPFHFQKLFSRWAGVSPKKYLQVLTVEQGKALLEQSSVLDVAEDLGLSSSSRLYDHFMTIEAMTPGEYKSQGSNLIFRYGTAVTPFGAAFIAQTQKGIHQISFIDHELDTTPLLQLQSKWPLAKFESAEKESTRRLKTIFSADQTPNQPISLHVAGTNFQTQVWKLLLSIQPATLRSYSALAKAVGKPKAARATANAIGANPVAYLIPCHRVIQQNGKLGGYRWGTTRKLALNAWEQARK